MHPGEILLGYYPRASSAAASSLREVQAWGFRTQRVSGPRDDEEGVQDPGRRQRGSGLRDWRTLGREGDAYPGEEADRRAYWRRVRERRSAYASGYLCQGEPHPRNGRISLGNLNEACAQNPLEAQRTMLGLLSVRLKPLRVRLRGLRDVSHVKLLGAVGGPELGVVES